MLTVCFVLVRLRCSDLALFFEFYSADRFEWYICLIIVPEPGAVHC